MKIKKILGWFVTALILGLIAYLIYRIGFDTLSNQQTLTEYIRQFGIYAPLAFFIIQFLQVIIAPIPGNITGLVGGAVFGIWWGFALNAVAVFLGSLLMFWLGRKYGKKITHHFIEKETLEKYEDKLSGKAGRGILFVLFLVPFAPDDALCLVAGLTNIDFKSFFLIMLFGRLPSSLITSAMGAGLYSGNIGYITLFSLIYYAVSFLIYWKYDKIKAYKNNRKDK